MSDKGNVVRTDFARRFSVHFQFLSAWKTVAFVGGWLIVETHNSVQYWNLPLVMARELAAKPFARLSFRVSQCEARQNLVDWKASSSLVGWVPAVRSGRGGLRWRLKRELDVYQAAHSNLLILQTHSSSPLDYDIDT
jgi:hypothetical protein